MKKLPIDTRNVWRRVDENAELAGENAQESAEDVDDEKVVNINDKCVEKVKENAELAGENAKESAKDLGLNIDTGVGFDVKKVPGGIDCSPQWGISGLFSYGG